MAHAPSSILASEPKQSLLACLLKGWKDSESKEKKNLIFLCTDTWPQYLLGDQEKWPSQASLN
jgi:hypothetical protein